MRLELRFTCVPSQVVRQVPKVEVQYVEKKVPKPVFEYVERVVEVPQILYQARPFNAMAF